MCSACIGLFCVELNVNNKLNLLTWPERWAVWMVMRSLPVVHTEVPLKNYAIWKKSQWLFLWTEWTKWFRSEKWSVIFPLLVSVSWNKKVKHMLLLELRKMKLSKFQVSNLLQSLSTMKYFCFGRNTDCSKSLEVKFVQTKQGVNLFCIQSECTSSWRSIQTTIICDITNSKSQSCCNIPTCKIQKFSLSRYSDVCKIRHLVLWRPIKQ